MDSEETKAGSSIHAACGTASAWSMLHLETWKSFSVCLLDSMLLCKPSGKANSGHLYYRTRYRRDVNGSEGCKRMSHQDSVKWRSYMQLPRDAERPVDDGLTHCTASSIPLDMSTTAWEGSQSSHLFELLVVRVDGGSPPRDGDAKLLKDALRGQPCCSHTKAS